MTRKSPLSLNLSVLYYQYFLMNLSLCLRVQRYNLFSKLPNLFSKIFLRFIFSLAIFAGAKVKPFFQLTKSFFKNFLVSFFLNFTPFLKAGAKLQLFSELPKLFSKKISSILMNLLPSRKRVQNYNNFLNWPNISTKIFWLFFKWLIVSSPINSKKRVLNGGSW